MNSSSHLGLRFKGEEHSLGTNEVAIKEMFLL